MFYIYKIILSIPILILLTNCADEHTGSGSGTGGGSARVDNIHIELSDEVKKESNIQSVTMVSGLIYVTPVEGYEIVDSKFALQQVSGASRTSSTVQSVSNTQLIESKSQYSLGDDLSLLN